MEELEKKLEKKAKALETKARKGRYKGTKLLEKAAADYFMIATLYKGAKDKENAEVFFESAGCTYLEMGDYDSAQEAFEAAGQPKYIKERFETIKYLNDW
ncbi:hypothetical protein GF361_00145 [Candidatus Woesearchaeota archaeon]|nr:hypothetical protein [Candidatus Woesearchaeota archaeon]